MNKSTDKDKKMRATYWVDTDLFEKVKDLVENKPLVFSSQARVFSSALYHFLSLPEADKIKIIETYITRNLKG